MSQTAYQCLEENYAIEAVYSRISGWVYSRKSTCTVILISMTVLTYAGKAYEKFQYQDSENPEQRKLYQPSELKI